MPEQQHINLSQALAEGRLADFSDQEDARGIGPIDRNAFATLTAAIIKAPQSKDQTSRSAFVDGSTGKRTR